MYCVIQELKLKRADTGGAYNQIAVFINPFGTRDIPQYGYGDAGEKFERPIKKAYKISIHESKRIDGVVTKNQFVVTTVNYYTLALDWFALGEYNDKITDIATALNVDTAAVYDVVDAKITPLQKRIQAEFEQTEEFITKMKHKEIINRYKEEKALFSQKYRCSEMEYDYCYNVFGELMNESHLEKIVKASKARRSYHNLLT